MDYFAQFISFWIVLSISFWNCHSWSFDAYGQPISITGPLREQFRPLTTPTMLRIETHEPWVRFVVHQSLATMLVWIVQLHKPTPSPVTKTGNNFREANNETKPLFTDQNEQYLYGHRSVYSEERELLNVFRSSSTELSSSPQTFVSIILKNKSATAWYQTKFVLEKIINKKISFARN